MAENFPQRNRSEGQRTRRRFSGAYGQAAKTIKRHWDGMLNWATQKISNGILKGYNSIFQASKAKARGYKRFDTIQAIIYLLTGKLDFSKINRYCPTHSF
jgi:transposase